MRKSFFTIFLLAAAAVLTTSCGGGSSNPPPPVEVHLIAQDILWSEDNIDGMVGQTLHFAITNEGLLDHTFEIGELEIMENIAPGETIELDVVFERPGVYDFFCSIPGHAEAGMTGTITISE